MISMSEIARELVKVTMCTKGDANYTAPDKASWALQTFAFCQKNVGKELINKRQNRSITSLWWKLP